MGQGRRDRHLIVFRRAFRFNTRSIWKNERLPEGPRPLCAILLPNLPLSFVFTALLSN